MDRRRLQPQLRRRRCLNQRDVWILSGEPRATQFEIRPILIKQNVKLVT